MKGVRLLAGVAAVAAAGCLWLFPIQKEEAKTSSGVTSMDGSVTTDGVAGMSVMTEIDAGDCTTNEDCGDPVATSAICRAHKCVPLKEEDDCLVLLGKWTDPNAFIFGAYAFYERLDAPEKSQVIYNYDLAIKELNDAGGLPDIDKLNDAGGVSDSGGTKHPLAAVVCNNDPSQVARDSKFYSKSLTHLVDDVGVSAIIADLPPNELVNAFQSTHDKEGKNIFLLSPGAANKQLLGLDDSGLIWNMIGPPSDLAPGYADLVRRIETYVRANASDAGTTPLRVAVVRKDDPTEVDHELLSELYDAVEPKLFFNGSYATDIQNAGNYRTFTINPANDGGAPSGIGDQVNAFAPHVVISMTGSDFTHVDKDIAKEGVAQDIMTLVKGGGPSRDPWVQHEYPFFIFSPVNAASTGDFTGLLISSLAADFPVLYQRFLGINVAGADDRDVLVDYQKRLRKFQPASLYGFENYYDSIYYLAYAVYAAGFESIDGQKISGGMIRLNGGTRDRVGPDFIAAVLQDVAKGPILLSGAGGSKFDPSTGARIDKAGLYCFQRVNVALNPLQPAEIFDPDTHMWGVLSQYILGDAMKYPDPCAPGL